MTPFPKLPVGNDPLVQCVRLLIACSRERTPLPDPSVRLQFFPNGFTINAQSQSSSPSPAEPPQPYLLTAIKENHLLCQPMVLNAAGDALEPDTGADAVYIAKPPGLWMKGWDGETVDGITYQFLDGNADGSTDSTKRTATQDSTVEHQRIVPYYLESFSIIYAMSVSPLGLTVETDPGPPPITQQITILDINTDGRAWARFDS